MRRIIAEIRGRTGGIPGTAWITERVRNSPGAAPFSAEAPPSRGGGRNLTAAETSAHPEEFAGFDLSPYGAGVADLSGCLSAPVLSLFFAETVRKFLLPRIKLKKKYVTARREKSLPRDGGYPLAIRSLRRFSIESECTAEAFPPRVPSEPPSPAYPPERHLHRYFDVENDVPKWLSFMPG